MKHRIFISRWILVTKQVRPTQRTLYSFEINIPFVIFGPVSFVHVNESEESRLLSIYMDEEVGNYLSHGI